MNELIIFDTTLRDGEQSPGASMTQEEKLRIAKQLEKLGVNVIEAGFAAASPGDFSAINAISEIIDKLIFSIIAGGAVGNFYDRLFYHAVPDFLDLHYNNFHWFTFNVADIFITLGILAFIMKGFFIKR